MRELTSKGSIDGTLRHHDRYPRICVENGGIVNISVLFAKEGKLTRKIYQCLISRFSKFSVFESIVESICYFGDLYCEIVDFEINIQRTNAFSVGNITQLIDECEYETKYYEDYFRQQYDYIRTNLEYEIRYLNKCKVFNIYEKFVSMSIMLNNFKIAETIEKYNEENHAGFYHNKKTIYLSEKFVRSEYNKMVSYLKTIPLFKHKDFNSDNVTTEYFDVFVSSNDTVDLVTCLIPGYFYRFDEVKFRLYKIQDLRDRDIKMPSETISAEEFLCRVIRYM